MSGVGYEYRCPTCGAEPSPQPTADIALIAQQLDAAGRAGWPLLREHGQRLLAEERDLRARCARLEAQLAEALRDLAAQDFDLLRQAQHYDHACRQCIPDGPSLIDGFACAYHRALARATGGKP